MRTHYETKTILHIALLPVLSLAHGAITPAVAAGNFCSTTDRILWTSNRNSPPPSTGPATETYNLFVMDSRGGNRKQLTEDAWPEVNQHPVFTTDCSQVLWVRGAPDHNAIWIMNADGSAKKQISTPPGGAEDGHPNQGPDGRVYFTRHSHANHAHSIWRMNADGSGQTELIGGHADRFHPNLRSDRNLVLYTSGPAGTGMGSEIRVFDQSTGKDSAFYSPGWPVSAAIWHPGGDRVIVAEDPQRTGRYRLVEVGYPSAASLRTLADSQVDNTVPYYSEPAAQSVAFVRWAGGRTPRGIVRMNADGSGQTGLTNDPYDNALILGELEITPTVTGRGASRRQQCKPRPVGCSASPPPCDRVLLPNAIQSDAQQLGMQDAQDAAVRAMPPALGPESYLKFLQAALRDNRKTGSRQNGDSNRLARALREFLATNGDRDTRERVAEFYVNSYRAAVAGN